MVLEADNDNDTFQFHCFFFHSSFIHLLNIYDMRGTGLGPADTNAPCPKGVNNLGEISSTETIVILF